MHDSGNERHVMLRTMLKSKIHRATVTDLKLHYQGSITVDAELLEKADILPGEQVHVLNVNTGDRFATYAIKGPRNSGVVILNGPAARLGQVGDPVIILTYCQMENEAARKHHPKVVKVDARNRPI
jgi:aspartate 1-decarboxylase